MILNTHLSVFRVVDSYIPFYSDLVLFAYENI